jgi:hypothetical protein
MYLFLSQFVEKRLKLNAGYVRIGGLGFVFLYFAHVVGCGFFFLAACEYRAGGAGLTQVHITLALHSLRDEFEIK